MPQICTDPSVGSKQMKIESCVGTGSYSVKRIEDKIRAYEINPLKLWNISYICYNSNEQNIIHPTTNL